MQLLKSNILTPVGWKEVGELRVGDVVLTPCGQRTPIINVNDNGYKNIYRITFSDRTEFDCGLETFFHTTVEQDRDSRRPRDGSVKSLKDIKNTLLYSSRQSSNHVVPNISLLSFDVKGIVMDPYVLGCIIGDGCTSATSGSIGFTTEDLFIVDKIECYLRHIGYTIKDTGGKYGYRIVSVNSEKYQRNKIRSLPPGIVPFNLPRKYNRVTPRTKYLPKKIIRSIILCGRKKPSLSL